MYDVIHPIMNINTPSIAIIALFHCSLIWLIDIGG